MALFGQTPDNLSERKKYLGERLVRIQEDIDKIHEVQKKKGSLTLEEQELLITNELLLEDLPKRLVPEVYGIKEDAEEGEKASGGDDGNESQVGTPVRDLKGRMEELGLSPGRKLGRRLGVDIPASLEGHDGPKDMFKLSLITPFKGRQAGATQEERALQLQSFLIKVAQYSTVKNLSEMEIKQVILSRLDNDALMMATNLGAGKTGKDLIEALRRRYMGAASSPEIQILQLQGMRQERNQTAPEYFDAVRNKAFLVVPEDDITSRAMRDRLTRSVFVNGLASEYIKSLLLMAEDKSAAELAEMADRVESNLRVNVTTPLVQSPAGQPRRNPNPAGIECWTCGQQGHTRAECPRNTGDGSNETDNY
jgi:hypothetical protein